MQEEIFGDIISANVKVLGDSSRWALDLCVGRLFRQTRVIASSVLLMIKLKKMINIIKKLEQAVLESAPLLEKVELKERHTKYLGDRGKTNLNMNISFEHGKLNWIYITLQWDIYHQFNVVFSRSISGDWYRSVHLSSCFYDLDEKEQIKRMNFFLLKYNRLVELMTNDENITRKRELLEKQREIQAELARL